MRGSSSGAGTATRSGARAGSLGFDLVVALLGVVLVGALHYWGWAQLHSDSPTAPLAPWNIALIVAFVAIALAILITIWRGRQSGLSWRSATPPGYGMSAVGLGLMLLGLVGVIALPTSLSGALDTVVSPAAVLMAAGAGLAVSGPLRAAWRRTGIPSLWRTHLAMLLSIAALLSVATFATQALHPFATQLPALQAQSGVTASDPQAAQTEAFLAVGVGSIVVQSALLMGLLLPILRRWTVPLGSLTLILVLNIALLVLMRSGLTAAEPLVLIGVALGAGIIADLVVRGLRPASDASRNFRLVAFLVPVVVFGLYFAGISFGGTSSWGGLNLWISAVALGGIAGWLLSFVVVPTGSTEGPKFR